MVSQAISLFEIPESWQVWQYTFKWSLEVKIKDFDLFAQTFHFLSFKFAKIQRWYVGEGFRDVQADLSLIVCMF